MYCPPIDHERFKKEVKDRLVNDKLQLRIFETSSSSGKNNQFSWIIRNPIEVFKLIGKYYMISNFYLFLQIIHILFLFHFFIKSNIYTFLANNNKEYLETIYFTHISSISSKPYILNYLLLGHSFILLLGKLCRIRNIINMSLRNATYYKHFRVGQLTNSYLASYYLSFNEWIRLWDYINKHEKYVHSNEATRNDHLKLNKFVRQKLSSLTESESVFYVNPIDFERCYADSILPNYDIRIKRYKSWHFSVPIDRISLLGLREIILILTLGAVLMAMIYSFAIIGIFYYILRNESPLAFSSPSLMSIMEIFHIIPTHNFSLSNWIRVIETGIIFGIQAHNTCDLVSAFLDIHVITSRAHKMLEIFRKHLEFLRRQMQTKLEHLEQRKQGKQNECLMNIEKTTKHNLYQEFNNQIRCDVNTTRLLYYEFLNAREQHTGFFNLFVISGGICLVYTVPVLTLHPSSPETFILIAYIVSITVPVAGILLYCAKMERMVSIFFSFDIHVLEYQKKSFYFNLILITYRPIIRILTKYSLLSSIELCVVL